MEEKLVFSTEEQDTANGLLSKLLANDANGFQPNDAEKLRQRIDQYVHSGTLQRNIFGLNPIVYALETAEIAFDEIGLKRDAIIAIVLYTGVVAGLSDTTQIEKDFGRDPDDDEEGIIPLDIDLIEWNDEVIKPHDLVRPYVVAGMEEIDEF